MVRSIGYNVGTVRCTNRLWRSCISVMGIGLEPKGVLTTQRYLVLRQSFILFDLNN
jgi:hypothetical protein